MINLLIFKIHISVTLLLITITQLIYRVKCLEDLHPCKEHSKDITLICDGSAVKITDEGLERIGS